jgi:hypothetical protein
MRSHAIYLAPFGLALLVGGCHQVETGADRLAPAARSECLASGGTISKVGMAQAEACVRLFADRGKKCRNVGDCEGECRYDDDTRGPPPPENSGVSEPAWMYPTTTPPIGSVVVGHCQWRSDPFGCRSLVVNGKLQETICVD